MLDLHAAFRNFSPDLDMNMKESAIDNEFITDFLMPYFKDLPRDQLAAKVAEIIDRDLDRTTLRFR